MEPFASETPFARLVSKALESQLTLLDIGCSGGIDPGWRTLGDRLRAFAFDPNLGEVKRLSEIEAHAGITYVPGFVGIPGEAAGQARLTSGNFWDRNPWGRLSVYRTHQIRARTQPAPRVEEKTALNRWPELPLADRTKPVIIPSFLREHGIEDVDFVKIDVDGADFLILRSLMQTLDDARVLGLKIEVNFFGSDDPDTHTFHNVDRLMKQKNFELFLLSTYPYSHAALPAPYQRDTPARTMWGRVTQGDAIYFRDLGAPENDSWGRSAGKDKLLKLAAMFSLAGLPDCAAEILLNFREIVKGSIDIEAALDTLAAQAPAQLHRPASYAKYIAEFEADGDYFYPSRESNGDMAGASLQAERRSSGGVARRGLLQALRRLFGDKRRS